MNVTFHVNTEFILTRSFSGQTFSSIYLWLKKFIAIGLNYIFRYIFALCKEMNRIVSHCNKMFFK